jgi:mpaB/rubber oxygenase-like protein
MGNTASWTDDFMNGMRHLGDPLADRVINELFADGDIGQVNGLMRTLIANEYAAADTVPTVVSSYLKATQSLPAWADPEMIKAGESLFWRYGPELILILTCYGLPFCYLGRNGVPVLALTSRLMSNPARRVLETAQMVVDVMQAGGLTSDQGRGRRTLQKVRLMHAAVRLLAPRSPEWKEDFGTPVNQEDIAGTLMAFSWIALDGLKKLGLELTDKDQEGYLHCWRLVGEMLGLQKELSPDNMEEAEVLVHTISRREFAPSTYGVEMTSALTAMLADMLPGNLFRDTPKLMIRYFLGEQWAKWLGAEESWWIGVAMAPLRFLGLERSDVLNDSAAMRRLAQHVGKLIVGSAVMVERAGNRPSFAIPTELKQQWGINWFS